MIYRVDYLLALIFAGLVFGAAFGRLAMKIQPSRLARIYFCTVVALLALRAAAFAAGMLLSSGTFWSTVSSATGDAGNFLFGALFGLAAFRQDRREFLLNTKVYSALCLSVALNFAIAGLGKAFSIEAMVPFFAQSGYSTSFLKFIVIAEVFGGMGLLIPWAMLPSLIGLSIDMFGAVATHIHNGDPIHDSTGAIGMLIRLSTLAVLWAMRRPARVKASMRASLLGVALGAVACAIVAVSGSALMRHISH